MLDIKNYFDDISQDLLMKMIREKIEDESILNLIKDYLSCKVEFEGQIHIKRKVILQGSPVSPVLSNLYLHNPDAYMEETGYHWIRFADNIYIDSKQRLQVAKSMELASIRKLLEQEVRHFQNFVTTGERYRPYKYY